MYTYAIVTKNQFDASIQEEIIYSFTLNEEQDEKAIKNACKWIGKNYCGLYVNDGRELWKSSNKGETYTRIMGLH